jgi:uridine kinase
VRWLSRLHVQPHGALDRLHHQIQASAYTPRASLFSIREAKPTARSRPFEDAPTFGRTLKESHDWAKVVGVDTVARINDEIETAGDIEFINVCEDRHNRMLAELGELIEDDIENIRLICVAGPSSSGKTTFANRLRIELLEPGHPPDSHFHRRLLQEQGRSPARAKTASPISRASKPSTSSFFNQNMLDLINGEEVDLPKFDFAAGHRVFGRRLKVGRGRAHHHRRHPRP